MPSKLQSGCNVRHTRLRCRSLVSRLRSGTRQYLLVQAPTYDPPVDEQFPTGAFSSQRSGAFHFLVRGGQAYLVFSDGRESPLIPIAAGTFWYGAGSTLNVARDSTGRVTADMVGHVTMSADSVQGVPAWRVISVDEGTRDQRNEIQAETSGEVAKVYVENGQPVEYGQPLFGIKPQ